VDHIIQCANFSARASLEREESRWGTAHLRTDYPDRDDKKWRCHILVGKGDDPEDIRTDTEPVKGLDGKEGVA
jgi:succinate dehydrogenase/fumarate reductase flavoprotein subunit